MRQNRVCVMQHNYSLTLLRELGRQRLSATQRVQWYLSLTDAELWKNTSLDGYIFFKAQGLKIVSFSGCNSSFANALFLKLICHACLLQNNPGSSLWAAGGCLARLKPLSAPTGGPLFTLGPQQEEESLSILCPVSSPQDFRSCKFYWTFTIIIVLFLTTCIGVEIVYQS